MPMSPVLRSFMRSPPMRLAQVAVGVLLLTIGPIIGGPLIPGPFGILSAAAGLALILRNSPWARRRYIVFKRRYPRWGHWTEVALRRRPLRQKAQQADQPADAR